ncbi:MAG: rRNA maturation RNase YbeY [Methylococcales bacterium]|nr:rRNA maturation RNase YbeY [Methylococcales bacterium]
MNKVDVQVVSLSKQLPDLAQFQYWVDSLLKDDTEDSEVVIRLVDEFEMIQFNEQYRDKKGTTNILSFPFEPPEGMNSKLLGDLLICVPVIEQEALAQDKVLEHHWAHMVIHGVLHLLGYDHLSDEEAEEMEALEMKVLRSIAVENPYKEQ